MNTFIPYAFWHQPTWDALADVHPIGVPVAGDDLAYLNHFRERWAAREPFVNVEHDMIVTPAHVRSFELCPEPWCAAFYDARPGQGPWLGCVRFRPELMDALPEVWEELWRWATAEPKADTWQLVGEVPMQLPPAGELRISEWLPVWAHLDSWLIKHAAAAGIKAHRHWPDVRNDRVRWKGTLEQP